MDEIKKNEEDETKKEKQVEEGEGRNKKINCVDMEKAEKKKCLEDKEWVEENKSDENKNKRLACRWVSGWEIEN